MWITGRLERGVAAWPARGPDFP